ncbi:bifunctional diaminohydroxyphosphoribosylaminopyrimidine deaminase/5-amino-6-(5-phosphoribosylamino)uracil reductase RibD [bacterium]|nr:bifunctional diaminohydroxyphosphoribosylaminopyrimidine deaminase/5-amino-6-(5-phosphoribosylamino)uracil reductase RibD [bacterium]
MTVWREIDREMMRKALKLAIRGKAWVAPNPMVGSVVVKDSEIVGKGYHRRFGEAHAEVNAIKDAGDAANGADLYVNLEPCSHHGKTPPCADLIVKSGIKNVYIAITDPNPLVNGKGIKLLEDAGIHVYVGLMEKEARELNLPYLKKAETGKAWVTLKIAQTVDGRIASQTGHSRWITSKPSRRYAHLMRAIHDGVLVGSGTVHADDCMLTVRHVSGRNPIRIVLDTNFRIPPDSKILNTPDEAATWVFGSPEDGKLPEWSSNRNVRAILVGRQKGFGVNLQEVIDYISQNGIMSLMVEGGSKIWTAFLDAKLADKVEVVIAPIILGHGIDAIRDLGILQVHDAVQLEPFRWRRIGTDLHIAARVQRGDE